MTLILVVSDNHEWLHSLTRVLGNQGFATLGVLAWHEPAIMRALLCDEPDVVLLDNTDGPHRDRTRLLTMMTAVSPRPSVVIVDPVRSSTTEMTAPHSQAAAATISESASTRELVARLNTSARSSAKPRKAACHVRS